MHVPPELPSVLLVEDSDEDADTFATALERSGLVATVHRVASGDACIAWFTASRQTPTLVIMDLNMPGMDGRQALLFIKSAPLFKAIPVIIFSTSSSEQDRDLCFQAGANAYHIKSLRYPDHLQTVQNLLQYWLLQSRLPEPGGLG